jgi:TRAP-type C4-dicarboxylate transport system permease small subunit
MQAIDALLGAVAGLAAKIACVLLFAIFLITNVEVGGRYFFNYSTLVADEYGGYLFVWMAFLGFAFTLRSGHFLRVEMLVTRLPPRLQRLCEGFSAAAAAILCAVLAHSAWSVFHLSLKFGSVSLQASRTPLYLPQLILPIGMAFLSLIFVCEAIRGVRLAAR